MLLVLGSLAACDRTAQYQYATVDEAKQAGSVQAAAIPDFVPPSARDIVGSYHVETNEALVQFSFPKSELPVLTTGFVKKSGSEAADLAAELHRRAWKPALEADRLDLYLRLDAEYAREILAVDKASYRAYWIGKGRPSAPRQ